MKLRLRMRLPTPILPLAAVVVLVCPAASTPEYDQAVRPFLEKHCAACHNNRAKTGDVSFEFESAEAALSDPLLWEEALLKLRSGQMPPPGAKRPTEAETQPVVRWIERELDRMAAHVKLDPGRVTVRRLNRAEYNHTVRDLLAIPFRPGDDFPADDSGYGFDNIGDVLSLPPLLMENYLRAADRIAAYIVPSGKARTPTLERYICDVREQARRIHNDDPEGYPYPPGAFEATHFFPVDAEYELVLRMKDRRKDKTEIVPIEFYFDGEKVGDFQVQDGEYQQGVFTVRRFVTAGRHTLYGDFAKPYTNIEDWDEQSYGKALFKQERRIFVDALEVQGPFNYDHRQSTAYRKLFVCQERTEDCAQRILHALARRAYRRPPAQREIDQLTGLVALARKHGDSFETGIQLALKAVLVSPNFLYRIERDPDPAKIHAVSNLDLASRLSYFLWSSTPDEELLALAEQSRLREPAVLEAQVRRMLKDPKSEALVKNFAGQWLQLRNLDKASPDPDLFPKFNDYLRQAMIRETELYFEHVMRNDRSILEFVDSSYTFLNARLAHHYGIEGVSGRDFRKVELPVSNRGGVLTQASVLTVSSYPTRTSPVLRGLWVLENFLGAPPPPPPAGVPQLDEQKIGLDLPLRKQLEQHRADPGCAVCHTRMDAIGFGLENFDAVGAWRTHDGNFPVDAAGTLPGGSSFEGPDGLKKILAQDRDAFARTLAEKMMTFALGRGVERSDRPAIQRIARNVAASEYRFSSLILEIVKSAPFRMRRGEGVRQ
ncbi:MAG: DUF1592 domain-containing protein [Bryobacteraceae bacterium]